MMHLYQTHKLEAQHVCLHFSDLTVFNQTCLSIKNGEIVGLVGENGSGKSTLLRSLSTYMQPNSGRILLNKQNIYDHPNLAKLHIGYLSQTNSYYPYLNIDEHLNLKADLYSLYEKNKKINAIKKSLNINTKTKAKYLSKGQLKKLALALTLIHEPTFILLDEPTTELDSKSQQLLLNLLVQCKKNMQGVFFSTHQIADLSICDRIIKIENNNLVETNILNDRFNQTIITKNHEYASLENAQTTKTNY